MEANDKMTLVDGIVGQAVEQPTAEELAAQKLQQELEERREQLAQLRIMSGTEVPPEQPTLTVDGVGVFAREDIHAIKGKQKCG